MANILDVSHVSGSSATGNHNSWVNWHSQVNNQVPFYLGGKAQTVKPSVSLNAGTNILFSGSANKTSTDLPTPTPSPSGPIPVPVSQPTDKKEGKPWYEDVALWFAKDWALPFVRNFQANPLQVGLNLLSPASQLTTIIGKGDNMAGTLAVLDLPGKVITSTMINIGRTGQLARQGIEGETPKTDYWADMGNAWNWSLQDQTKVQALDKAGNPIYEKNDDGTNKIMLGEDGLPMYYKYEDGTDALDANGEKMPVYEPKMIDNHDNIDIGTAWAYMLGQTNGIANSVSKAIWRPTEEEVAALNKASTEWGFAPSNSNFDIFSQEQRDSITGVKRFDDGSIQDGTGNGWTLGNVGIQTLNFIGDLATDPLTYVPFGKVGRVAFAGRNLLTNGTKEVIIKRVAQDADILTKAAAGESTVYNNFLNFAANNTAERISNHVVIRSFTSGERDQIAYLLGQVTKPEDAAKVLLAVEYGSTRATKELVRDYSKVALALDEFTAGGGYIARGITNGKILPEADLLDHQLHETFYNTLMAYSADFADDVFAKTLRDTAFKVTEAGVSPSMLVRELTPVNLKNLYLNKTMSALDQAGARVGTFFVNGMNHINSYAVESSFKMGTKNFILHQIVRLGSKSAKGIIDVSNIDGVASGKFYGMLNDVDRVTKGALSRVVEGEAATLKSSLTQRWMTATTPTERAQIIEEVNAWAINKLAVKHGANDLTAKTVAEELMKRRFIHQNNLDKTGLSMMTHDNVPIVYSDPYAVGKGTTEINLWDWNKVDTEFAKQTNGLLNFVGTPIQGMVNMVKEFNGLFNALVVARFARLPRDIMANMITVTGSGYGKEIFKQDINGLKHILNPLKRVPANVKTKLIRKGNLEDTVGAIGKLEEERLALENGVLDRWTYINDYMATMPLDQVTLMDIQGHLGINQLLERTTGYHVTPSTNILKELSKDRPFITFADEADAGAYGVLNTSNKVINLRGQSVAEMLKRPDTDGVLVTTEDDVFDAINSGFDVQVRVKGRKRDWQEFNYEDGRVDVKKYEYRYFNPDEARAYSEDELRAMLADPSKSYFSPTGEPITEQTIPLLGTEIEKIIEMPTGGIQVYKSNVYAAGQAVDIRDLPFDDIEGIRAIPGGNLILDINSYINLKNPSAAPELGKRIQEQLDLRGIGFIRATDNKGREVIISNPTYTQLDGFAADANGEVANILTRLMDYNFQPRWLQASIDYAAGGKKGVEAFLQGRAMRTDLIPGSPYSFNLAEVPGVPMPKGWTITSKPADGYSPEFFVQIGGPRPENYAVRFAIDPETKKLVFAFIKPTSKIKIKRDGKDVPVSEKMWFRLQAQPGLSLGDFIKRSQLKKITKEALLNLDDIAAKNLDFLAAQQTYKKALDIPADELRHLEDMTGIGTFSPQVLMDVTNSVNRYGEVVAQLDALYQNLNFVSGKLSKKQQQLLADTKARLNSSAIKASKPQPMYDDWIREEMRDLGFPPQQFAAAITGRGGDRWFAKIQGDARDVRDQGTGFLVKESKIDNKTFKPNDQGYWNAWTRTLNEHWRMPDGELDPVVRKWLEGIRLGKTDTEIKDEIKSWLTDTPAGQNYSDMIGIGHRFSNVDHRIPRAPKTRFEQMSFDDYIEMQQYNVVTHVGNLGPTESQLVDGMDFIQGEYLYNNKQAIVDKILKGEEVTQKDLVDAWLNPSTTIKRNRDTGALEEVGPSEYGQLPEIWGTYADPVGRRTIIDNAKVILRNFNRVVADTPQEILFQTPLFRAAYAKSVDRLTTQMRISTGRDFMKEAELTAIEEKARSFALAETRKWIYSAQEQRNIMNGIRMVVPFANATIFTAKWMANVAKERPVYAAWMVYEYNKAINGVQWFDQNGNVADYDEKDTNGDSVATHLKFNYPSWLVNILAGKSPDDPWAKNYVAENFISRTSLDPIWNGNNIDLYGIQVPNPFVNWGVTPGVAIGISELIKQNLSNPNSALSIIGNAWDAASKAGILPDLNKFGPSQTPGSVDLAIPPILAPFVKGNADPVELIRLKVNAGIYLYGRYTAGLGDKPTPEMVDAYALGMYDLKHNSSFWLPFSTKYVTAGDMARQTFQTYLADEQDAFDKLGPSEYTKRNVPGFHSYEEQVANLPGAKAYVLDPYTVAIGKFMNEHPDLFYGAVSAGSGDLKLRPNATTAENITKYGKLIPNLSQTDEGVDVLSDVLNGDTNSTNSATSYVFDQNVYNLLVERKLITKSSPDAIQRRVQVAKGNQLFRSGGTDAQGNRIMGMNELDNLAFERNTPIANDPYLSEQKARLTKWVTSQPRFGQVWADNRSTINPQRYNNTAAAWNEVLANPQWRNDAAKGNNTWLESADKFLEWRGKWKIELQKRSQVDPTQGTLAQNPDIANQYYDYVFYLKNYDTTGKFSEWYNSYFEGDTIN